MQKTEPKRCDWAKSELDIIYHDTEWGKPTHDDRELFEFLILEGMQAGLSWSLVLKKREAMREAFDGFNPEIIAGYGDDKIEALMQNEGIIRNRRKLAALPRNAKAFLEVQQEFGSFDAFLWGFVQGKPVRNPHTSTDEMPATSPLSDEVSKVLKKRGFTFVGSTICYSFLQAAGLINDHLVDCDFA